MAWVSLRSLLGPNNYGNVIPTDAIVIPRLPEQEDHQVTVKASEEAHEAALKAARAIDPDVQSIKLSKKVSFHSFIRDHFIKEQGIVLNEPLALKEVLEWDCAGDIEWNITQDGTAILHFEDGAWEDTNKDYFTPEWIELDLLPWLKTLSPEQLVNYCEGVGGYHRHPKEVYHQIRTKIDNARHY